MSRARASGNLELARRPKTPGTRATMVAASPFVLVECLCCYALLIFASTHTMIGSRHCPLRFSMARPFVVCSSVLIPILCMRDMQRAELRLNTCLLSPVIMPWRFLLEPLFELDRKVDST